MRQHQYGLSVGGPVVRDRTFFFANVEQRDLSQSGLTTISDASVATINARLAATGYPGSPVATGVYPNPVHSTLGLAKLDHQAGSHQMSLRYSLYLVNADNSRGAGGLGAPSASAGLDNSDHSVAFSDTWTLSSRTVNEDSACSSPAATSRLFPPIRRSRRQHLGGGLVQGCPEVRGERVNTLFELVDTLSHQAGAHALRAGADFLYNDDAITYPRSVRGAYTFSSLANFLAGTYNNAGFTQTFGDPRVAQSNPYLGLFAQDEWHAGSRLTVNAGLRYDLQLLDTIATDADNLSAHRVRLTPWAAPHRDPWRS
jgi:outer membrane receptor protein involved in Fe transport